MGISFIAITLELTHKKFGSKLKIIIVLLGVNFPLNIFKTIGKELQFVRTDGKRRRGTSASGRWVLKEGKFLVIIMKACNLDDRCILVESHCPREHGVFPLLSLWAERLFSLSTHPHCKQQIVLKAQGRGRAVFLEV